jgi:hypothetical protein
MMSGKNCCKGDFPEKEEGNSWKRVVRGGMK